MNINISESKRWYAIIYENFGNFFFNLIEKAQVLDQSSFFSQNVKKLNLLAAFNEYYAYVYEECKV